MTFEETIKTGLADHFEPNEIAYILRSIEEDMPQLISTDKQEWQSVIDRLINQEPIQYITGIAPFYGYFFNVNPSVLIPRPETEELVYLISEHIKKQKLTAPQILDIGSGSGCIPITLNLLHTDAEITSIDVSEGALSIARSNNDKLNTKVNFLNVDILDKKLWGEITRKYDVIVSNPPYIPNKEKELMSANVLDYEPHLALFVDDIDPLIFYRRIYEFARLNLNVDGSVFLECNEYNAQEVREMYGVGFDIEVVKDMQGKDRMVKARMIR